MDKDFLKILGGNVIQLTRSFVEIGQDVVPVAFVVEYGGDIKIAPTPMAGPMEKRKVQATLIEISRQPGVQGILWITDSWRLHTRDMTEIDRAFYLGISEHPDRTEALTIDLMMHGHVVSVGSQPYTRNPVKWESLAWQDLD